MKWGALAYVLNVLAIMTLVAITWLARRARKKEAEERGRAQREAIAQAEAKAKAKAEERERQRLAAEAEAKRVAKEKRLDEERAAAEAKAREAARLKTKVEASALADAEAKAKVEAEEGDQQTASLEVGAKTNAEAVEATDGQESGRAYRAPVLRPQKPSQPRPAGRQTTNDLPRQSRALELRLQVLLDRHGFATLNVLAAKPENSGDEFDGQIGTRDVHFAAIADKWLHVAQRDDLRRLLGDELRIRSALPQGDVCRWSLSKRSVYVLAPERGLAGFVSTARLRIGYEQVVLCRADVAEAASRVLSAAGCVSMVRYGVDRGVPDGWALFKAVAPKTSVPQGADGDILNILRPLPEIEIQLEGGLRVEDTTWLSGFPPDIRVLGTLPPEASMQIDAKPAECLADGRFVASGYDTPGNHSVFISGKSATFRVQEYEAEWQAWKAHDFGRGDICGAAANAPSGRLERLITVPTSTPVLVGAVPGEILVCSRRPGNQWTGFVPFEPVWALPADPLHSDKSSARAILLKPLPVGQICVSTARVPKRFGALVAWCVALGNCQRKGLPVSPASVETQTLWRSYQQVAGAIRRKLR